MQVTKIADVKAHECAQYQTAKSVLIYRPEEAVFLNCMHPAGSLYQSPNSSESATAQHLHYQKVLQSFGINVYEVNDVLAQLTDDESINKQLLKEIRDFAFQSISYRLPENQSHHTVTDEYKLKAIAPFSTKELVRTIMTNPILNFQIDSRNTGIEMKTIEVQPMGNCVFSRDQQITTKKGVVMGNFQAPQRAKESRVFEFALRKLGITPIGHIDDKSTLEGGDFITISNDIACIGAGKRRSYSAAQYLMRNDLLGFKKLLVVKDIFEQNNNKTHLDCIIASLHEKLILMDETVLESSFRRYVDEYVYLGKYDEKLQSYYQLSQVNIELEQYLLKNDFQIVKLPGNLQQEYGCDILNLGLTNSQIQILSASQNSIKFITNNDVYKNYCKDNKIDINFTFVPFDKITAMHGALHCASQVIQREAPIQSEVESTQQIKDFKVDYLVVVPQFCGRDDLVEKVVQKCAQIADLKKSVCIVGKYNINKFKSLQSLNKQECLQQILQQLWIEKEDGNDKYEWIQLEDCVLKFGK